MQPTTKPVKTYAQWSESKQDLGKFLAIGDAVDDSLADYFIEVLPPATMRSDLIQIGEPYSHVRGRATFSTIHRIAGLWIYCGHCHKGEFTEPAN